MKVLEFKTKIKNNQILIPTGVEPDLRNIRNKDIRVIILVDDYEDHDDNIFREATYNQFLKGYAASDSIYDYKS